MPQIPWLFSGTVRDNILFGEPYEESKYGRIIEACALAVDIQQFPEGDKAVVGERGAALSGGQRARVSYQRPTRTKNQIDCFPSPTTYERS